MGTPGGRSGQLFPEQMGTLGTGNDWQRGDSAMHGTERANHAPAAARKARCEGCMYYMQARARSGRRRKLQGGPFAHAENGRAGRGRIGPSPD